MPCGPRGLLFPQTATWLPCASLWSLFQCQFSGLSWPPSLRQHRWPFTSRELTHSLGWAAPPSQVLVPDYCSGPGEDTVLVPPPQRVSSLSSKAPGTDSPWLIQHPHRRVPGRVTAAARVGLWGPRLPAGNWTDSQWEALWREEETWRCNAEIPSG